MNCVKAFGPSVIKHLVLWLLFFSISLGLGYPTLNRYDPRQQGGLSDSRGYYELVTGRFSDPPPLPRLLIPYVAKPFYWAAQGRVGSWDPVFFGLLAANALFCATTAFLLVSIGVRAVGNDAVAHLGATLYLLNFGIANSQMSGAVDSGEACLLMAVGWSLFTERWHFLPFLGILGSLAKEHFHPFAFLFALIWWLVETRRNGICLKRLIWVLTLGLAGITTLTLVWSHWYGYWIWPWAIVRFHDAEHTFLSGLRGCLSSHEIWYYFGWLLPLGVWKLKDLPRPWVVASLVAAFMSFLLGAWIDNGGNVARPMFSCAGPVLSLSVAVLLSSWKTSRPPSPLAPG